MILHKYALFLQKFLALIVALLWEGVLEDADKSWSISVRAA